MSADLLLDIAQYSACALASVWVLWIFFCCVIALRAARDAGRLVGPALKLGMATLYVGWLVDAFVNIAVMSVVFFELPLPRATIDQALSFLSAGRVRDTLKTVLHELTVTARLTRLIRTEGWRQARAIAFCRALIEPIDPGHCGELPKA